MKVRAHVIVSGTVQGVCFRTSTRDVAVGLGVSGWVRNVPGGKVEAVFEGEKEQVDKVLEFCRKGPQGAEVNSLNMEWEGFKAEFTGFKVRF